MISEASARQSEMVCFRIDGEWLTDHCRSLVTEGRWRLAMATLIDGLPGISTDQVFSVLRGSHKLLGVNEVVIVPEDRLDDLAKYQRLVRYQFGGIWRRSGRELWQPYAIVTHLGSEDLPGDVTSRSREKWGRRRILYYADDPKKDIQTDSEPGGDMGLAVLWRKLADPPLWIDGHDDSGAALAEALAIGRRLEERGASFEYTSSFWQSAAITTEERSDPADRLIENLGLTGKMADAARAIAGDGSNISLEPDREFSSESGYILPDGRFYGCPYMHHSRLADRLLRDEFKVEAEDPQKEADNRNWLRIQASAFIGSTPVGSGFVILSPKGRPTTRQKRALADWCIAHEQPYPQDLA
jgi:hypothetical protein